MVSIERLGRIDGCTIARRSNRDGQVGGTRGGGSNGRRAMMTDRSVANVAHIITESNDKIWQRSC